MFSSFKAHHHTWMEGSSPYVRGTKDRSYPGGTLEKANSQIKQAVCWISLGFENKSQSASFCVESYLWRVTNARSAVSEFKGGGAIAWVLKSFWKGKRRDHLNMFISSPFLLIPRPVTSRILERLETVETNQFHSPHWDSQRTGSTHIGMPDS